MTKASDNVYPRLLISEGGSTSTPAAATVTVYAKADGLLYSKDDAGAETALGGGGGDITTDPAWAAAGDLIVASGNNAASVLTKGTDGDVLTMVSGAVAWDAPAAGAASGCIAKFTTPVTANADPFAVTWNATDQFDPDGYHDPASNNTRLTVPTGKGSRLFLVWAQFENSQNTGTAEFRLDGSVSLVREHQSSAYAFTLSAMLYLTAGQYVEVLVRGLNGKTLITTDFPCAFGIAPVG